MILSYLRRHMVRIAPALAFAPFLMGADGEGCGPGAAFGTGPGDAGPPATDAATDASGGSCTPADCPGSAPVLLCPSDATSETSCVPQAGGGCDWSTPVCVVVDAGHADACSNVLPPCAACPNGSTGTAKDANGCDTCPICVTLDGAPPPDAAICACPAILVTKCSDGSSPPMTSGPAPCYCPQAGPCPVEDGGNLPCTSDANCPTGSACGFPEADACMTTKGECFPLPGVECNAIVLGCACDGTDVNVACNGLPSGYAPKPLKHTGACVDGG
jgi:hypothetical protein